MLIKEKGTYEAILCEDEKKVFEDAIETIDLIISQMEDVNCEYFENSSDDYTYSIKDMDEAMHILECLLDMDTIIEK